MVDGIQKRLDHVLDRDHLQQRLLATLAPHSTVDPTPDLERRLAETEKRIGRLVGVLADGADDLASVRARLAQLERERGALKDQLTSARYRSASRAPSRLAQVIEELIGSLSDMRKVLAAGGAEERKAIEKAFLNGIRIEASAGRTILRSAAADCTG